MHTFKTILISLAVFVLGQALWNSHAPAQSYAPSPIGKLQFFDNVGRPLSGGRLFTYAAGTTTLQSTYQDSSGTPNTDPIILDSAGRAAVYFGSQSYKFVLQDSNSVTLWTADGLSVPGLSQNSVVIPSGKSLTLQPGSSASVGTSWLPDLPGTRALGAAGREWNTANINTISALSTATGQLNVYTGPSSFAGNSTFAGTVTVGGGLNPSGLGISSGSASIPWMNMWSQAVGTGNLQLCPPLSGFCYHMQPQVDGTNSFVTLSDIGLSPMMKWSRVESGLATNQIVTYVNLIPAVDASYDLGASGNKFAHLFAQIVAVYGNLNLQPGASLNVSNGSTLAIGNTATITVPVGSVFDGTEDCTPGAHVKSMTFSKGYMIGFVCD